MTRLTGHGHGQAYVNLPGSGSDSDDVIHDGATLTTGVKVRKHKRSRKPGAMRGVPRKKSYDGGANLCSFMAFAKVFVFVLLLASVVVLGAISYWLQQQIQTLKDEMTAVEHRNKDAPEQWQQLQSQLQTVNQSVQTVRSGKDGLVEVAKNISLVSDKVSDLNSTVNKINKNLAAAPVLMDLPHQVESLSQTLASMGSDVKSALASLGDMKKNLDALEARVATLEGGNREVPGAQSMPSAVPPYQEAFRQRLEALQQRVDTVNGTCSTQFQMLSQKTQTYEPRFSALESQTAMLSANVSALAARPTLTQQQDLHDKLQAALSPSGGSTPSPTGQGGEEGLVDLRTVAARVDNITAVLASLLGQHSQIVDDHANLNSTAGPVSPDFQRQTEQDIKLLNVTVGRLQGEVDQLFAKLTQQTNSLVTVNHTVFTLAGYLHESGIMNSASKSGGSTPVVSSSTASPTVPSNPDLAGKSAEQPSDDSQTAVPRESVPTVPAGNPSSSRLSTGITIQGITNEEDLKMAFASWDLNGDRQISLTDLKDFLGPKAPDEEVLRRFDKNGDGLYSLEEMAEALSISLSDAGNQ